MSIHDQKPEFKPKARLLLQLGDQLIRNESIALLEIIKNSYDACAGRVEIRMNKIESQNSGEIIIEDDGTGMSYEIVRDVWLQPGTTFKKNQIETENYLNQCNRIPLGEKGIGRFGVHKLGNSIELISRMKSHQEVRLAINWQDFDNDKMLNEISLELTERTPEVFTSDKTGTKIIIRNLRNSWTRGSVRELYRAVNSLNSPFESINAFKVIFKLDRQEWLSGLLKFKDIQDSSLFSARATIKANKIESLDYEFTPWNTMKGLKGRKLVETNINMVQKVYDEKTKKKILQDIDLSEFNIGEITIRVMIFDFDTNILSLGTQDKKGLKDYLKTNGGIRVYRDGIRVYDYGEPGNDWLSLDLDRVNLPTARISNNIVIGAVTLNRRDSTGLVEKTNREGFLENKAFNEFYSAIRFTLSRIITQRNIDKDKIRSQYSKNVGKVPVVDNLQILKNKISDSIQESSVKTEILNMIAEVESDYKTISEIYIRSASAGLSLSIVIHEIEKIISELMLVVDEVGASDGNTIRIKSLTKHLGKLVDGYSGLIRRRSRSEIDLVKVVDNGLWNIEFRLKAHNVDIINAYRQEKNFATRVRCSESLIVGTIVNIIDNSIWWMSYARIQQKSVFIDIVDTFQGYLTVIIADNGPGFTLPVDDVVKPFISNKEGGIGIGLHIASEIMAGHKGELLFPDPSDIELPTSFNPGAIIGLAFPIANN